VWLGMEVLQAKFETIAQAWNFTFPTILYGLVASVFGMVVGSLLYPSKSF
jgi:hypothetical protein